MPHLPKITGAPLLNHRVQVLLSAEDYLGLLEMAKGQDLSAFMRGLLRDERTRRQQLLSEQIESAQAPDSP